MCTKSVSFILVLILSSTIYGIQLGDFENNMDGWSPVEPNATTSFSTIGATLNQNSLRIEAIPGTQDVVVLDLVAQGLVNQFKDNLKISLDITRLTSEWIEVGSRWCELFVTVKAGGQDSDGIQWDVDEQLEQAGSWIPAQGDEPLSFTYDYSLVHSQIDYRNLQYLELVFVTNYGGYEPGGVYYVDNVQMFGTGAAYAPEPPDGERELPVNTTLRWTPGLRAHTHDVYFGTKLSDVTNASRTDDPNGVLVKQAHFSNTYDPGELISGTSYFWRIDAIGFSGIIKGDVWTFTTEYPGKGVVLGDWEDSLDGWNIYEPGAATLSYSTTGATLNNKSLRVEAPGGFWVLQIYLNAGQLEALKANDLFALDVTWVDSEWQGHSWSQVQMISINSGATGWQDGGQGNPLPLISDSGYPDDPGAWPSPLMPEIDTRTLIWDYTAIDVSRIEEGGWTQLNISQNHDPEAGAGIYYFDNARLLNVRRASNPNPAYQQTDVRIEPTLSWLPGRYAVSHNVYVGIDIEDVADVNMANLAEYPGIISGNVDGTSFQPGRLEFNTNYYWRVDEVNDAHPEGLWKGDVWTFTTGNFIVVDDFEAYNDINIDSEGSNRIYMTWTDGYVEPPAVPTNGSTIGYPNPSFPDGEHFVETDIVHGGGQSAPLLYDNSFAAYSEVTVNTDDLAVGSDWTRGDVRVLRMWFYGDPNNATTEQLYVKLGNAKVLYDGDVANLGKAEWIQWDVELTAFSGVNLANVTQFGIGLERIGASRGSGMLFIDDIRLYRAEP